MPARGLHSAAACCVNAVMVVHWLPSRLRRAAEQPQLGDCLRARFPSAVFAALQAHLAGLDVDRVRVQVGLPWYVFGRPRGYTSPYRICISPDCESAADLPVLIAHELTHVRQYAEHGTWRFRWRYLREYLAGRLRGLGHRAAYLAISYEREARAVAERVRQDGSRFQAGAAAPVRAVAAASAAGRCSVATRPGPLSERTSRPR